VDAASPLVVFDHVSLAFDDTVVLRDVSFTIREGTMGMLIGASGTGKSVVLRLVMGLLKPDAGEIHVGGARIDTLTERQLMRIRADIGMLFQESALFDSLTVADNVGYHLVEETRMPMPAVRERVEEVLGFVGLRDEADRMPSELSGGQRRRVAIARALAAKPRLLLLDDPTSGLDPITARTIEDRIITLRDLDRTASLLVTHQLPAAFYIATHEAVRTESGVRIVPASEATRAATTFLLLRDGGVSLRGTADDLRASADPYIRSLLSGWVPPLV
jgi:phospholipid/cholesterol/gamma-HCH transport system ATP-binding protein